MRFSKKNCIANLAFYTALTQLPPDVGMNLGSRPAVRYFWGRDNSYFDKLVR